MKKIKLLNKIKELYDNNENIISFLKEQSGESLNDLESILISYDFQAGSYIQYAEKNSDYLNKYTDALAKIINSLTPFNSIIEIGVGEATTLGNLLKKIPAGISAYGFDISWSRIFYAQQYLKKQSIDSCTLFTGDFFNCPLTDNSIDIVYTSHSIEPNGGKEKEALEELYRITNKYLVLLEPAYDFATEEGKSRMIKNGYITKLYETVKELNYKIIEHRPFKISSNPLNPTGLTIIEKSANAKTEKNKSPLACPITKTGLIRNNEAFYSPESLLAYPIIKNIPCLTPQNAIVATHFMDEVKF